MQIAPAETVRGFSFAKIRATRESAGNLCYACFRLELLCLLWPRSPGARNIIRIWRLRRRRRRWPDRYSYQNS